MNTLEICCFNVSDAQKAQACGADRIELCSGAAEGGLTPSYGTLKQTKNLIHLPVHPIIRPRGGDFYYDRNEFAALCDDVQMISDLGFPGAVIGILTPEGDIDGDRLHTLMAHAPQMAFTFHRAFDLCRSPLHALDQLKQLGVARILTSGQQPTAVQGCDLLRQLHDKSQEMDGPQIMAGAGVRAKTLSPLLALGLSEFHSSARLIIPSHMRYQKNELSMASTASKDHNEFSLISVDTSEIIAMKQRLISAETTSNQP